ncbi:MAG: ATP-binding protein [Holosporaceae bacterium]|jgi:anti-sigma regulatory factor (Ser/Thr protein kinase)|nr:ATP-binding protein [Holosporaceae bacterium]
MPIKIKNNIEEIGKVCEEARIFCSKNDVPDAKYHDVAIILDEVITNIISYAYPDGKEHFFSLDLQKGSGFIRIKFTDDGVAFDPLTLDAPDTISSLKERKVGGLGVYIVKQLAKSVKYSRANGRNQLEIKISTL